MTGDAHLNIYADRGRYHQFGFILVVQQEVPRIGCISITGDTIEINRLFVIYIRVVNIGSMKVMITYVKAILFLLHK